MALNNLDRFVAAARNPLSLASLFERDREALPTLLQIFSTSQYLSDLLIAIRRVSTCCGSRKGSRWHGRDLEEICSEAAALTTSGPRWRAAAVQTPRDAAHCLR